LRPLDEEPFLLRDRQWSSPSLSTLEVRTLPEQVWRKGGHTVLFYEGYGEKLKSAVPMLRKTLSSMWIDLSELEALGWTRER